MNHEEYEKQKELYKEILVGKTVQEARAILSKESRKMTVEIWHPRRPLTGECIRNNILVECENTTTSIGYVNGRLSTIASSDGKITDIVSFAW